MTEVAEKEIAQPGEPVPLVGGHLGESLAAVFRPDFQRGKVDDFPSMAAWLVGELVEFHDAADPLPQVATQSAQEGFQAGSLLLIGPVKKGLKESELLLKVCMGFRLHGPGEDVGGRKIVPPCK